MKRHLNLLFFLLAITHCFCQTNNATSNSDSLDSLSIAVGNGAYSNVDAVVISRNGKIYYEKYFNGFSKDSLHASRSSFKSITGLLTGIAIDKGFIKSVHERVYSFFPEYKNYANPDKRKDSMTIQNLLEMKSGYDCEEWNTTKDCEAEMINSSDWIKFSLDLPLLYSRVQLGLILQRMLCSWGESLQMLQKCQLCSLLINFFSNLWE